jgi:phage protein D
MPVGPSSAPKVLNPSYKILIDGTTLDTEKEYPVKSILVNQDMAIPAHSCEIVFGLSDETVGIEKGKEITVEMGYEDGLVRVFEGTIDKNNPGISEIRVVAMSPAVKLLLTRCNQVFLDMSAGDIASTIAGDSGFQLSASPGANLRAYYMDSSKNAYEHLMELAVKSGFNFYVTSDNELFFGEDSKGDSHKLEYGVNVIQADAHEDFQAASTVWVVGETFEEHFMKDQYFAENDEELEDVKKKLGIDAEFIVYDASIKDVDTAKGLAKGLSENLKKTLSGTFKIIGNAEIKLGDEIQVSGMKHSKMNGDFQVRSIEHYLSKTAGFTTLVGWRGDE